jgi:hypothetical protein
MLMEQSKGARGIASRCEAANVPLVAQGAENSVEVWFGA